MSNMELIRKFYYGQYKTNSYGNLVCPLYDNTKNEDDQICKFSIRSQGDDLNGEEFQQFWSHVEDDHEDTYVQILNMCRLKTSIECKANRCDKTFDIIGCTFGNLNKLVSVWRSTEMNHMEFITKFKSELTLLEKQVVDIVKPMIEIETNATSTFSNL